MRLLRLGAVAALVFGFAIGTVQAAPVTWNIVGQAIGSDLHGWGTITYDSGAVDPLLVEGDLPEGGIEIFTDGGINEDESPIPFPQSSLTISFTFDTEGGPVTFDQTDDIDYPVLSPSLLLSNEGDNSPLPTLSNGTWFNLSYLVEFGGENGSTDEKLEALGLNPEDGPQGLSFLGDIFPALFGDLGDEIALALTQTNGGLEPLQIQLALAPVPVPAALPLFLSGLAGLGFVGYRRRRKADAAAA